MDKYAGLFYGNHYTTSLTFKKALLLYDEVHFLDRSSFTLRGQYGTVGKKTPYRRIPPELEEENVKIICHEPPSGIISEPLKASIAEDMRDERFVHTFIRRFLKHEWFSSFFLKPRGRYSIMKNRRGIEFSTTGEEIN